MSTFWQVGWKHKNVRRNQNFTRQNVSKSGSYITFMPNKIYFTRQNVQSIVISMLLPFIGYCNGLLPLRHKPLPGQMLHSVNWTLKRQTVVQWNLHQNMTIFIHPMHLNNSICKKNLPFSSEFHVLKWHSIWSWWIKFHQGAFLLTRNNMIPSMDK